jgi:hypothetical protein
VGDALKVVAVMYSLLKCACTKRCRSAAIQRVVYTITSAELLNCEELEGSMLSPRTVRSLSESFKEPIVT